MARDLDERMIHCAVRIIKRVRMLPRTATDRRILNQLLRRGASADCAVCLTLFVIWFFIPIAQPPRAQTRAFGPNDMVSVVTFAEESDPVISPAGDWVAYAAVDVDNELNILARHPTAFLHVVKSDGSGPRTLPNSRDHADTPVWSPDGRKLAFLCTREGRRQAFFWDAASGQVRELGEPFAQDHTLWSSEGLKPEWTPDGKTLVVAALESPIPKPPAPRMRVLQTTDEVVPGDLFFVDRRLWRVMAIDVPSGRSRWLTPTPSALRQLLLSPDGKQVLLRAVSPATLGHFRAEKLQSWIVALDGGTPPRLVTANREGHEPSWLVFSADGSELLFPESGKLLARSLATSGERVVVERFPDATRLPSMVGKSSSPKFAVLAGRPNTGPRDRNMYSILRPVEDVLLVDVLSAKTQTLTPGDRQDELSDLTWSADGQALFYHAVDPSSFEESLHCWSATTGIPSCRSDEQAAGRPAGMPILQGEAASHLSVSSNGHAVAFTAQSAVAPTEGYVWDADKQSRHAVTHLNPQLSTFQFVAPEVLEYRSADGEPLHALLFKPQGATSEHPVPVVTYVYEKLSPSKNHFNLEAQMHVSHGYSYLMPDVLVRVGETGESFVKSVVPAVNAVRATGFTNGKFGINGGSFGGYAGLFLISHVDIFAAAVLRAPPSEFFSTWGDGRDRDIWTIETGQARTGGSPWQIPQAYISNSPFFQADRVHTPVLILHGEKDYTVPLQQGVMMFSALRALKKPAEMVLYREGDHSIVRGSRDDYLDYYNRVLEWWEKYLK
jgi:dipeptidyl aminopeptidase/acylaminoacyl peptidase